MHPLLLVSLPLTLGLTFACSPHGSADPPEVNDDEGGVDGDGAAFDWPSLSDVDAAVLAQMDQDHVPGLSACIIEGEEIAWCQGYGWADMGDQRVVTPDTPFLLASVSKVVTATAVMQGVEEGLYDLDDDIDASLPFAVQHPRSDAPLTRRQLLAHTAGVADNWDIMDASYTDHGDSPVALGDFLESYLVEGGTRYDADENFVGAGPDRTMAYTNVGNALAGYSLEAASGLDFAAWCETSIFTPLGMADSAWFLSEHDQSELAVPYEWRRGDYEEVGHYGFPDYPSGQLRSSAVDVARFLRATMQDGQVGESQFVCAESVAEMTTVVDADLDRDQGLGWYRWRLDGETVWGHNGGEWGASAEILWWPERDRGVVVLMNSEGDDDSLAAIERILRDAEI